MSEIKEQNINPEKIIKESLLRLSEILDSGLAITLNDQIISNYHPPYSFKYEKNSFFCRCNAFYFFLQKLIAE